MNNTLFLFLISPRVNVYINVIAHAVEHHNINEVCLIHLTGSNSKVSQEKFVLLEARIWHSLQYLSEGYYLDFDKDLDLTRSMRDFKRKAIEAIGAPELYGKIKGKVFQRSRENIEEAELGESLCRLAKIRGGVSSCMIDITSAPKLEAVGIFSICSTLGFKSIHTFDLTDEGRSNKGSESLYHALEFEQHYHYPNLLDLAMVSDVVSLTKKNFELLLWVVLFALAVALMSSSVLFIDSKAWSKITTSLSLLASVLTILFAVPRLIHFSSFVAKSAQDIKSKFK